MGEASSPTSTQNGMIIDPYSPATTTWSTSPTRPLRIESPYAESPKPFVHYRLKDAALRVALEEARDQPGGPRSNLDKVLAMAGLKPAGRHNVSSALGQAAR